MAHVSLLRCSLVIDLQNFEGGVITALVTPLTSEGNIKGDVLGRLIDFQTRGGIKGFFLLGTYGEGLAIHPRKRMEFLERFLEYVPSNVLVIVNASSTSPEVSLEIAKHAVDLGIKAVSLLPPLYYAQDLTGLIRYFSLFSRIDVSLLIYNNPRRQNYDISPTTFELIAREVPNLRGMKDSSGSIERVHKLLSDVYARRYFIAIANDSLLFYTFLLGGKAHICGLSNAFPEIAHGIYTSVLNNELKRAVNLQNLLNDIREAVKEVPVDSSVVVRELMRLRGIDPGHPSLVNRSLGEGERTKLLNSIRALIHRSAPLLKELGINIDL